MSTDIASNTNSINLTVPSSEGTEQLENAAVSVTKQSESDDTNENDQSCSSLEVNVSLQETEVSGSNSGQNTESINGDKTQESADEKEDEEEWLDILGSGQLKKKVSTWLNVVTFVPLVSGVK
jgi:hypothetical protein